MTDNDKTTSRIRQQMLLADSKLRLQNAANMNGTAPAFPDNGGSGITIRDYFAAAALTGSLAFPIPGDEKRPDKCARYCYEYADAMLAERSKTKGEA